MANDSTRAWFAGLVGETQQRMRSLSRLQEDPQQFYGRAQVRDGVTAVVAPGGSLVDLSLTSAALRLDPRELAGLIVRAQREAGEQANRRYAAAVQEAIGGAVDVTALVERRLDEAGLCEADAELRQLADPDGTRR